MYTYYILNVYIKYVYFFNLTKVVKMQNAKTKNTTSTVVKSATITYQPNNGIGINGKLFWQFINTHCGGQLANAYVKVLPTTNITNNQFTAIGNKGGKGKVASNLGGVRKAVQNWCIFGITPQHAKTYGGFNITKTSFNLLHILGSATKWGHTKTNPTCVLALLNGGYSQSAKSWGTSFIQITNKQ